MKSLKKRNNHNWMTCVQHMTTGIYFSNAWIKYNNNNLKIEMFMT